MKTGNRKQLTGFLVFTLLITICNGFLNIYYGEMADVAIVADFSGMIDIAKKILLVASGLMISVYFSNKAQKRYFRDTMIDLRRNYIDSLFKRHRLSKNDSVYVSHLSNDSDRLEKQYYGSLLFLLQLVFEIVISTLVLARYSTMFIAVVFVLAIIFYLISKKTSEPIKVEEKNKSKELEGYTQFVTESLEGFEVVKSHQIENKRESMFVGLAEALKKQQYKIEKQRSLVDGLNGVVQGVIIGSLMVLGLYYTSQSGMSLGSNIVIVLVFGNILWPLQRVTPLITEIHGIQSVLEDYEAVLFEEETVGNLNVNVFEKIEFIEADLGYDSTILENVNLEIQTGEKVLIVGPSGAGKSTILKSIQRDIDLLGGNLKLNGNALSEYNLDDYYGLLSIVDQIGFIFSGSIQENISMLQNESVDSYLADVSLSEFESNQILMNNGENISGGQRARLLLARALYFNKQLVVCDEILSSLDGEVAKSIERDILTFAKTLINVSHIVFVDNLPLYDKYIIVDEGRVLVTKDKNKVLERMLDSDIEFK